jgi:hypothetical protein
MYFLFDAGAKRGKGEQEKKIGKDKEDDREIKRAGQ